MFYNKYWLPVQAKNSDSDCEEILDSGEGQPSQKQVGTVLFHCFSQRFFSFVFFLSYVFLFFVLLHIQSKLAETMTKLNPFRSANKVRKL